MDRAHSHDKFSRKIKTNPKKPRVEAKSQEFPLVSIDRDADFASIKLAPGVEAKSYLKDGVLFSEDARGRVIEVQILNVSLTTASRPKKTRKAVWLKKMPSAHFIETDLRACMARSSRLS